MKPDVTLMNRLVAAALLMAILLSVSPLFSERARAQSPDEPLPEFVAGEVVVQIKEGASIDDVNERNRTSTILRIYGTNFYRLQIPNGKSERKWRKRLKRDPDVLTAELNELVTTVFARSIMSYPDGHPEMGYTEADYRSQQRVVELLKVNRALLRSRGEGVTVAVIDTGVDRAHPAYASQLWRDTRRDGDRPGDLVDNDGNGFVDDSFGWDFYDNDNDPSEEPGDPAITVAGHGTFISGLIALLAPGCRIMPLRAFNARGLSNAFNVAGAVKLAVDKGAQIINLSCGTPEDSDVIREAIDYARELGVTVVSAAGNQGTDALPQYPAKLADEAENVIAVAAVDQSDLLTYFSNFGRYITVAAPGSRVFSSYPGGTYAMWSGTSFATPIVTAEAALLLAANTDSDKIKAAIETSALNIDTLNPRFAGLLGKGRIDPLTALINNITGPALDIYALKEMNPIRGDAKARGQVEVAIAGDYQVLRVEAAGLDARAQYNLVIDGVPLATNLNRNALVANEFGGLEIVLSNYPGDDEYQLPSALSPVTKTKHIELRNDQGRTILQSDFLPVSDAAPPGQYVVKEASLVSASAPVRPLGMASVGVYDGGAAFIVEIDLLTPGASYQIIANGESLGSAIAQNDFVKVEFTTDGSSGQPLPAVLKPVVKISHVEVRDSSGQLIAQGTFRFEGGHIGF